MADEDKINEKVNKAEEEDPYSDFSINLSSRAVSWVCFTISVAIVCFFMWKRGCS